MNDQEIEKIIKSNMNLQINLAGIRQDFEEKLNRTWIGLDEDEQFYFENSKVPKSQLLKWVTQRLKEKNT